MELQAPLYVLHWRAQHAHDADPKDRHGWLTITHIRFGTVEVLPQSKMSDGVYPMGVVLRNYSGRYVDMQVVPQRNGRGLQFDIEQNGIHGKNRLVQRLALAHTLAYSHQAPYAASIVVDVTNRFNVMLVKPHELDGALDRVLMAIGVAANETELARHQLLKVMSRG